MLIQTTTITIQADMLFDVYISDSKRALTILGDEQVYLPHHYEIAYWMRFDSDSSYRKLERWKGQTTDGYKKTIKRGPDSAQISNLPVIDPSSPTSTPSVHSRTSELCCESIERYVFMVLMAGKESTEHPMSCSHNIASLPFDGGSCIF
uniref:Uncharacterized protein n=1 Tax=Glossina palpalis gambiensis TaxID=67801 RepID=A0A1B0AMR3_9MUSC